MKIRSAIVSGLFGMGLCLILLWMLSSGWPARAAPHAERHVCLSGCAYNTIQAAVDAAETGDVVKVASGTYVDVYVRGGITQVVYISK